MHGKIPPDEQTSDARAQSGSPPYRPSWRERLRFAIGLPLSLIYLPIMLATVLAYLLMPRRMFIALQQDVRTREVAARMAALRPYVNRGETLLDVGAGSGDFLKVIGAGLGAEIIGVDIIDYSDDDIDVLMFDGKTIPLEDRSVDISIAAFVLHHTSQQAALIGEMKRVTRQRIIIFEDAYFTPWQWLFLVWNDFYANQIVGSIKAFKSFGKLSIVTMPMPLTFRRVPQWEAFFAANGLALISTSVRHARIKPMSKVTFVLELAAQA